MSLFSLIWRTMQHHVRSNVAVLLGVLVGTTVLTGALLVGDSLQGSLRDRALRQLGWVDQVLIAPRVFRQDLADEIRQTSGARVAPMLILHTTVRRVSDDPERQQVRGVTILGVEDAFFEEADRPGETFVQLNEELARQLGASVGTMIEVRLIKPSPLPRETVLGRKDVGVSEWRIQVTRVLQADEPGNHFNLRPGLEAPRNLLVPLAQLQEQLGLEREINAFVASGDLKSVKKALQDHLTLEDRGLMLFTPQTRAEALLRRYDRNRDGILRGTEWFRRVAGKQKPRFAEEIASQIKRARADTLTLSEITEYFQRQHPYLSLESKHLLLPAPVVRAALTEAAKLDMEAAPTLVYLCRLRTPQQQIAGVVAALDVDKEAPLGPFLPEGKKELASNEIVLVEEAWPREKRPAVGELVTLVFKPPESHGPAEDVQHTFRVAGYLALKGVAADPTLTPEFPGITDKDDTADWRLPFEDANWQQQTIRQEYREEYWDRYRATPKAYIRLEEGQKLWSSRFGSLTSIRLGSVAKAASFREALRGALSPEESGFVLEEVKASALEASKGGTPFGLLFLGFSFFLILAALLLVGLLYRLNLERRAKEIGVLFAEGYPRATIRRILLVEGGLLALGGMILGSVAALSYSRMLIGLLATLWPGGVLRSFLEPHWTWGSVVGGGLGALLVSLLTIAWVVRGMSRVSPRVLLSGQTQTEQEAGRARPIAWWQGGLVLLGAILGLTLLILGPRIPGHMAQAGTFFGSGGLLLTAGLGGLSLWMRRSRQSVVEGHGWRTIARLGVRNAARHPARSMLTVGLLAAAAFLLVAVESFRRKAEGSTGSINAPDGGFALIAEADIPIIRDLNSPSGRKEILEGYERKLAEQLAPAETRKRLEHAEKLLEQTDFVALRSRSGDDASCLNLYQPRTPRILGVPRALIERGGFHFEASLARTDEEKKNPWLVLLRDEGYPTFGEANTVTWMLKRVLGQTLEVTNEQGEKAELTLAGLLHDSVFQSSLLLSEEHFLRLYPGQEGYNYFLIAPPEGREQEVIRLLELALDERGFAVTRSAERLEAFLAVENTYLTTFQALGGLGLILGSLGLAVVLLRAVWERRGELALLRALGWPKRSLGWLVLAENVYLLLAGLILGTVSALVSIVPQLLSGKAAVPWQNLALLLALVLGVAWTAGVLAVLQTLRAPLIPALRRD